MSRWPSPSRSTNCGVELVHHHTPGHFGHLAFGLQPVARRELAVAEVLEDADLALVELPDEQVLLAVAVDVGPAGRRVAGAFDADRHAVRLEADRRLELGGAADGEHRPPGASRATSVSWLVPRELEEDATSDNRLTILSSLKSNSKRTAKIILVIMIKLCK